MLHIFYLDHYLYMFLVGSENLLLPGKQYSILIFGVIKESVKELIKIRQINYPNV